jgi:hypothetical protein
MTVFLKVGGLTYVDRWPMWLRRHDNLPPGCLARYLWRMLT